jgi:hypothetical protein
MSTSLPILLLIAAMVLLLGVVAVTAIILLAKRCNHRPDNNSNGMEIQDKNLDAWVEAGKRLDEEFPEQEK